MIEDRTIITATPDGGRARAFFGRRKGHRLRPHQAALIEELLPRLAIDLAKPPDLATPPDLTTPPDLAALFPQAFDAVRLEIGFGGGEHLLEQARSAPHTGFIGCEPFVNGMAKILALIEATGVDNIRLYAGDAVDLLRWLPAGSLAGVDLLYADPWPKRRHWKRRFVQDDTVAMLAHVLRPGASFRFASDIPDYVAWALERLLRSPQFAWTAERADDWRLPWPGFSSTRYEAKAKREGRVPCYLVFRRLA
jgi:tRNA (guanine-N7-)-methyltransferase